MYLCQEIYSQRRSSVRCFSVIHDRSISTQNSQRISAACRDQWTCVDVSSSASGRYWTEFSWSGWVCSPVFHHRASLTNTRAAFWSTMNFKCVCAMCYLKTERSNKHTINPHLIIFGIKEYLNRVAVLLFSVAPFKCHFITFWSVPISLDLTRQCLSQWVWRWCLGHCMHVCASQLL